MTGKDVERWADEFMFTAETSDAAAGPQAYLLGGPNDPLGQIAACAKMYLGEVVRDLADVTDDERRYYAAEMQKTKLKMPLEAVNFHFMIEGVTRGFTHQMVRQRTAAYAQESTRFAVKEDMTTATALPPSLAGTVSFDQWAEGMGWDEKTGIPEEWGRFASERQKQRFRWDEAVKTVGSAYMDLVNTGMPAEDARGLMPTNITTRLNYITNLRGILDHAGNRLCTQAQFEWRVVFAQIANALRAYGRSQTYRVRERVDRSDEGRGSYANEAERPSAWQYEVLADLFRPVCYATGKCEFMANFDRKCSIRDRVQASHDINRSSTEWGEEYDNVQGNPLITGVGPQSVVRDEGGTPVFIGAIHPREWLADPAAAR
jgi:flavin-dependent thymidylate synthase